MLLLILFAGCLALCAGQTTVQTTTPVLLPSDSGNSAVARIQSEVLSSLELNETIVASFLKELSGKIQQLYLDADVTLTVKNITRV